LARWAIIRRHSLKAETREDQLVRIATILLAGAAAIGLLAGAEAWAQSDKPIVIGAAVARSGWMTMYDDGPFKALQLAIDDINAKGGVLGRKLELAVADTKTDPAGSARAAAELLEKGASFVVTSCDFDFGGAAALVANSKGVPAMGTCAADPKFGVQGIGKYAFTMATGTPGLAALSAEWAFKKAGWKKAYILKDMVVEYTKSVCDYFKERWLELAGREGLVGEDTFHSPDMSFPAQISRLRAQNPRPDFIFACTGGPGGPAVIRQIRAAGIGEAILATDSMDGDTWLQAVPGLSNFHYGAYGSLFGDDPNPKVRDFMKRFEAKFGGKPVSSQALTGYSAIEAFALAADRAKSLDGAKLVAALETFKNEPLLVGATTFTPNLHINLSRGQLIMKIDQGKHRALEWYAPEKVPAPKL
jgi:branched-chain amino acid transport system substrate-binding protein